MKQKRPRDKSWDDYGISKFRYRELKNFCLQYQEKKDKIQYGISSIHPEAQGGSSVPSDPTSKQAINHVRYLADIQMIESCAMDTNVTLYQYILKSVTEDKTYEEIEFDEKLGRIPCGRTEFYGYRRQFYYLLNRKKYA